MDKVDIVLFGDQSHDIGRYFHDALQAARQSNLVYSFLEKANTALASEFSRQSRSRKDEFPQFTSLEELGRPWLEGKSGSIILSTVLLTTAQLVDYIGYREGHLTKEPSSKHTYLVGLCTGQLVASAVACAEHLTDLVPLAVEAVCTAFRLGVYVDDVASTLHLAADPRESWASSFRGVGVDEAQKILDDFHESRTTHTLAQAYVSAVTASSVTISGPPRTLLALTDAVERLRTVPHFSLPIYGPYHAAHLFEMSDMEAILRQVAPQHDHEVDSRPYLTPVLSSKTGEAIKASSFSDLMRKVLREILESPLRLDRIANELVSKVKAAETDCRIIAVGPANIANSVSGAIHNGAQCKVLTEDFASRWPAHPSQAHAASQRESGAPGIAIVGYSGRFPGADNAEALWDVLEQGLDLHKEIPTDRFNPATHVDPTGKKRNTSHTPYGCFIDNPGHFDPGWFNMSPREAKQTDPMQRLFLMTAYEALEMSGYVPNRTPSTHASRIGTICGQTSDDYREVNAGHHVGTYFTTGTIRAFGPGRVNYFFKLDGPSYNIDTACSSSLAAIQIACTAIWRGEADTFVAGGVNIMTAPDQYAGLSRGQFLSRTGPCKTFDNDADGYCRGESIGTVILKRLDMAKADKDTIFGIIRSAGTNHSANAVSITHPHAPTQETLYRRITREARLSPLDIDYIEMHGTGTQAGDNIEMTSVSNVFAPELNPRHSDQPLYVGAVKANVGHGEAASGVTALIKSLLMFRHNTIPPHVGIKDTINESFPDLKKRNIRIPLESIPFHGQTGRERRVLVNNFSAAGGNTALILEEHLNELPSRNDPRRAHVVALSGRNVNLLRQSTERVLSHLDKHPATSLANLSYTTTARRQHGRLRTAVVGDSLDDIKEKLSKILLKEDAELKTAQIKEVAFAFTGQGAVYASMARDFLETVESFREDIEKFDAIGQRHGFPSFLPLLDGVTDDATSLSPAQTQLGLICVQIAMTRLYRRWGISPSILIGHSLGEYAALHAAGILSISDTIYLVGTRAVLLTECCTPGTHSMLAVGASVSQIESQLSNCDITYEFACRNAPKETVLSGSLEAINAATAELSQQNFKCTKIRVPYAFHSAQVDAILERYQEATKNVVFNSATIPLISPSLQTVIDVGETIDGQYLCRHARDPVHFMVGLEQAQRIGTIHSNTVWLEIGPHPLCSGMIKGTLGTNNVLLASMRRDQNIWKTSASSLAELHCRGLTIDWTEYHRQFENAVKLIELPRPAWELDDYWIPYQNDWTLTKGDPIAEEDVIDDDSRWVPTTTVHRIVEEYIEDNSAEVVFESDMNEPLLRTMVMGHLVNGTGLCPSSIYADMALTAADYIHQRLRPDSNFNMDVSDMKVSKPVIISPDSDADQPYLVSIRAKADLRASEVRIQYTTGEDKARRLHATCCVRFGDGAKWEATLARTSHLIENRMKDLDKGVIQGTSQKLRQRMVYKLFSALVAYSDPFRGMQSVVLGDTGFEGVSNVTFQTTEENGDFFCSPYWIDSIVHLSGFVLNANDSNDSDEFVFISHGWESMQFLEPLQQNKSYRTYVSMIPERNTTMMVGDVYTFEADSLVAFTGGVRFQKIPRKQLNMLLPPAKKKVETPVSRSTSQTPKASRQSSQIASSRHNVHNSSARPSIHRTSFSQNISSPGPRHSVSSPSSRESASKTSPRQSISRPRFQQNSSSRPISRVGSSVELQKLKTTKASKQSVLDVIAEEIGINPDQLQGEQEFSELGVDSLLSLSILGRLREQGMHLPETTFLDYPTVASFNEFIQADSPSEPEYSAGPTSPGSLSRSLTASSRLTTRTSSPNSSEPCDRQTGQTTPTSSASPERSPTKSSGSVSEQLRAIIADEMGLSPSKLTDDVDLASLGMDSLMSLSVIARLREETDLNPSNELFSDNQILGEVEAILSQGRTTPTSGSERSNGARKKSSETSLDRGRPTAPESSKAISASTSHSATSVLLQSGSSKPSVSLFLLPDGSGSATSYAALPNVSSSIKVYGLNCPFLREPKQFTCGFEGVASLYIDEMKRRQPNGPYMIGGWSAGGIIAYEMTRQLLDSGDTVDHLFLIDAPCPLTVPPMPSSLIDFFNDIGLFSDKNGNPPPTWLLDHFAASVSNLKKYEPKPLAHGNLPKTTVMWGRDGVCHGMDTRPEGDDDISSKHWILEDRTDFGGNGWEKLLGEDDMQVFPVSGNHFSIMKEPNAGKIAEILRNAVLGQE